MSGSSLLRMYVYGETAVERTEVYQGRVNTLTRASTARPRW